MKTIDELLKELNEHEAQVYEIIIAKVEKLARVVLANNRGVKEFCMAMGMFSIIRTNKDKYDYLDEDEFERLKGGKELYDFITEHDERFKITGDPMRFIKNGPVITDW